VIYNWGVNNVYAGEGGIYNIINNYYKYGPSTNKSSKNSIFNPFKKPPTIGFGKFYIDGNFIDGADEITKDNWKGVTMQNGSTSDALQSKLKTPFNTIPVKTETALDAYQTVLKYAGAVMPVRDTLDARIINDVINRTGKIIDVQGGYTHGTAYEQTIKAWPVLKSLNAPKDSDTDGMPDTWELKHKLNPADNSDASLLSLNKSYTNIESYLNELVTHPL
jgi:hypothetical protein